MEGHQKRSSARVVAQSMQGDGIYSLWVVLILIDGGQDSQEEAKKVRDRAVATVEESWKAGNLEEQLLPG